MVSRTLSFVICACGIFVCYFYFGIIQEKINRGTYIYNGVTERFNYVSALVGVQCVFNCLYAAGLNKFTNNQKSSGNTPPLFYAGASLAYLLAMVCSNKALQWVNYPTQVVGKSCKPIPVMLLGVLFAGRRYPLKKYIYVFLIVLGVATFMYKGDAAGKSLDLQHEHLGQILLLLSLLMDGVTGAFQERIKSNYRASSGDMMFNMNYWSVIYSLVFMLISGEAFSFVGFIQRHPSVIWELVSFSVASALGQYFIYWMIVDFGPLSCSITTTTRKFFTVLGSVFLFGNVLSTRQWFGATAVFTGLVLDAVSAKSSAKKVMQS